MTDDAERIAARHRSVVRTALQSRDRWVALLAREPDPSIRFIILASIKRLTEIAFEHRV